MPNLQWPALNIRCTQVYMVKYIHDIFETYTFYVQNVHCAKCYAIQTGPIPLYLQAVLPHFLWQHYLHHLEENSSMVNQITTTYFKSKGEEPFHVKQLLSLNRQCKIGFMLQLFCQLRNCSAHVLLFRRSRRFYRISYNDKYL